MSQINREHRSLPNKAFDIEYSTQWKREKNYLEEQGIKPSYIKTSNEYNIPTYKYTKNQALFKAVADFYQLIDEEKSLDIKEIE